MSNIRLAIRALVATPVVTAAAIASLVLGIGLNTAIFSLVNSLLLRTLPVAAPDQLVMLVDANVETRSWSNPLWEQIRDRADVYDGAFAWSHAQFNLARSREAQLVEGIWASGDFFQVLGVPASPGRTAFRRRDPAWHRASPGRRQQRPRPSRTSVAQHHDPAAIRSISGCHDGGVAQHSEGSRVIVLSGRRFVLSFVRRVVVPWVFLGLSSVFVVFEPS